ncbi:EthD domain-containing protein [Nocardioides endophyticus]|uniref:EthD domain-containing protein n=1 Tax=Nocardioides endophyticus TaxID=1353775 RepID=A0ABP8YQK8_9ACTN
MTKTIFVVWGDDLPTSLRDRGLHARLAAAGVRRLQVNIQDEHIAGAMRIDHLDEPIAGFVTVWDVEAAPVAEVLRTVATSVHAYAVDERRRLDPPESWDGSRADALANVAVLRRPDELDQAEWLRRWMIDHTAVGIRTQATFGYIQNIVTAPLTDDAPRIDGIVEELFPSAAVTDIHAFYGSGGDDAELGRRIDVLMASVGRIGADRQIDLVPTSRYLYALG